MCIRDRTEYGYGWVEAGLASDGGASHEDIIAASGADRPSLETVLHGPSTSTWGGYNLVGGLRRAMAKCGYTDIKSFQKVSITVSQ